MEQVRQLTEGDIPQVAELHERIFGDRCGPARAVAPYLTEIFCRHPWREDALPSLVYEGPEGRIIGCLGVMPRRMSMAGRPIRAAISHTFMVAPEGRATMAAMRLLQAFFSGPQDLSMAEGNSTSRKIWEGLGGDTALLYSMRWTRPLRPVRYLLTLLRRRGVMARWDWALRLPAWAGDAIAARPLRPTVPQLSGEPLTEETFLACRKRFSWGRSLRAEYDVGSLRWLFDLLARKPNRGVFRKVLVRDRRGQVAGWYLYYLKPGDVSEVVQLAARRDSEGEVLEHLFRDAWLGGCIAVSGQLDPAWASPDRYCVFHDGGGASVLIHSKQPAVLDAIHRGHASLSRLDGEWWIGI